MREYFKKLPEEVRELIRLASQIAAQNNMPAYLVGGCVRDLILGVKNLDLDIAVEGDGIKFSEDFAGILNPALARKSGVKFKLIRHRRFGTATISIRPNLKIDIATARKETYPHPASLPVVTPGSLKDDLARRDFSINAMAISIARENFGQLMDFFAGKDDLRHKKIRVLHALSFIDDPTRILRAIRFEKRYDFRVETKTLHYLKEAVRMGMLEQVESQRVRDELILVLKEKTPLKQIRRIQKLTGFSFMNPHLRISKNTYKLLNVIRKQISWFERTYAWRRQLDIWLIYFMGLIDSLNINEAKAVCKKFVFRKGEEKRILTAKKAIPKIMLRLSQNRVKSSEIFTLLEPLSYEVILLLKAKSKNAYVKEHFKDFFKIYNGMRIQICGDDLRKLGVQPGPQYQKIFNRVLKAKLNGLVKTKEEELALMHKLTKKLFP